MWPVVGADGGACWFGHDDNLEEDPPCRDVAATSCRVVVATAWDGLAGRVRRLERIVEQIGCVLVPQITKGDVDGFVGEQIGAVPVPQIWEPIGEVVQLSPQERVQNCMPEQIVGVPVPQLMEAVVEVTPQERVQNRFPEKIVGVPCASDHGGSRGSFSSYTTGTRAGSYAGADYRPPCASDYGGSCGSCAFYTTAARAESSSEALR